MNILLTKLPISIEVDGINYRLKTDFRDWISFELLLDNKMSSKEKLLAIMKLLIDVPKLDEEHLIKVVEELIVFYNCGNIENESKNIKTTKKHKRIYSFDKDQYFIYADFIRYYNIDLNTVSSIHWWKFRQMFLELPDDSKTKTVMMYRSMIVDSKMPKAHRQFYYKMKQLYALEDNRSTVEKSKTYGSVLAGHMTIDN